MKISKRQAGVAVILIIALGVFIWKIDKDFNFFGGEVGGSGTALTCPPLAGTSFDVDENGTYQPPLEMSCFEGVWVNESKEAGANETYCNAYFELVEVFYTDAAPTIKRTVAQGNEFCWNNTIISSPRTCGNFVCDSIENASNCWVDCGAVSSWANMKEASELIELQTYLEAESDFLYDYEEIELLAKEVERINPSTPLQAIKYLTRLISDEVAYVPAGRSGNRQCGEKANVILDRGYGNCVDYSIIMIATLRRGFDIEGIGRVRVPARQVAGCLNGYGTWGTVEYNFFDDAGGLKGEILGHSWVEIFVGDEKNERWNMADPTTNAALAKNWFGYHKIKTTEDDSLCYVPIESRAFCEIYSTGVYDY